MAFTNNYRLERVYFEKLKSGIDILKSFLGSETDEKIREMLKNGIDDNGAILLLYRNLGEAWAELQDLINKVRKDLQDLDEKTEAYHDELNEKIDEVNNYIMAIIRQLEARLDELEARVDAVEQDLATMPRLKFLDLYETQAENWIQDGDERITFEELAEMIDFPHYVILRKTVGTSKIYFIQENSATEATPGGIDFNKFDIDNDVLTETIVTMISDNSVIITTRTIEAPEYTAGFGIDIDANNGISVDTTEIQEKLIAGQNITLTPDTTDPTKTVIDAAGANYTPGWNMWFSSTSNEVRACVNNTMLLYKNRLTGSGDYTKVSGINNFQQVEASAYAGKYGNKFIFDRFHRTSQSYNLRDQNNKYRVCLMRLKSTTMEAIDLGNQANFSFYIKYRATCNRVNFDYETSSNAVSGFRPLEISIYGTKATGNTRPLIHASSVENNAIVITDLRGASTDLMQKQRIDYQSLAMWPYECRAIVEVDDNSITSTMIFNLLLNIEKNLDYLDCFLYFIR